MKIDLGATDELSQSDGKPKHIIALIDGKQLILPLDKTILELIEVGEKLSSLPARPVLSGTHKPESPTPKVAVSILPVVQDQPNTDQIEIGDTVTYLPKPAGGYTPEERCEQMNGKVSIGAKYRVLGFADDGSIEIIDDYAPTPQRVPVMAFDVQLSKKNPRVRVVPIQNFESIIDCPFGCKDKFQKPVLVVLTTDGTRDYQGPCEVCQQTITAPYPTPEKVSSP